MVLQFFYNCKIFKFMKVSQLKHAYKTVTFSCTSLFTLKTILFLSHGKAQKFIFILPHA